MKEPQLGKNANEKLGKIPKKRKKKKNQKLFARWRRLKIMWALPIWT